MGRYNYPSQQQIQANSNPWHSWCVVRGSRWKVTMESVIDRPQVFVWLCSLPLWVQIPNSIGVFRFKLHCAVCVSRCVNEFKSCGARHFTLSTFEKPNLDKVGARIPSNTSQWGDHRTCLLLLFLFLHICVSYGEMLNELALSNFERRWRMVFLSWEWIDHPTDIHVAKKVP